MSMAPIVAQCIQLVDDQLASSQREMSDVRTILEDAIARLMRDRSSATALQFQDISDQMLAHASRRLQAVREQMEHARMTLSDRPAESRSVAENLHTRLMILAKHTAKPVHSADLEPGAIELF